MSNLTKTLIGALALALGGCAAQGATHPEDSVGDSADALHATSENFTYFSYRQDYRKCAYPACGGMWVSQVNRARTMCADGSRASECYVADVDWDTLDLDGDTVSLVRRTNGGLLRGTIESNVVRDLDFGRFVPTEAWLPATSAEATGRFWRMNDNGIRCITTPCFSLDGGTLNRRRRGSFSGLDLSAVGATTEQFDAALAALGEDHGLMVAGRQRWEWSWTAGWSRNFTASQFFVRATTTVAECVVSGCSSQVCGDELTLPGNSGRFVYAADRHWVA